MTDLHPLQIKLLNLLSRYSDGSLSMQDMADHLDLNNRSLVQHLINQLEKKRYLYRNPNNSRDFKILKSPDSYLTLINVYGTAQCGFIGSLVSNDPIERIPISPSLINFDIAKAIMVIAQGDSMEPEIKEGDRLIVEKTPHWEMGRTHVCTINGEVVVKKIFESEEAYILVSVNDNYSPITVHKKDIESANSEFYIEGVVRGSLSYN